MSRSKNLLIPGWYILLYHDISWEETPFVRHIGGTCPPDVFRDHVSTCESSGNTRIGSGGDEKTRLCGGFLTLIQLLV